MLDEEVVKQFTESVEEYTLTTLQDALKVAYVNANAQSIFTNVNQPANHFIPTGTQSEKLSGAARLISNRKNNGGN